MSEYEGKLYTQAELRQAIESAKREARKEGRRQIIQKVNLQGVGFANSQHTGERYAMFNIPADEWRELLKELEASQNE